MGAEAMRCTSVEDIVREVNRIIADEEATHPEKGAEFFFRGESKNYLCDDDSALLGSRFSCYLDREPEWIAHEREIYEEALRMNVASFRDDPSMVEQIARMQHYLLPTRFADISSNALLAAHFACGGGKKGKDKDNGRDGFIRIIKVASHKMKSYTSDIILAIAHLPLVDADKVNPSSRNGLDQLAYEVKNSRPGFCRECERPESGFELRNNLQHVWAFKPILNSARIRAQGGAFLAFGCRDGKVALEPSFSREDYCRCDAPSYGIEQVGYVRIADEAKKDIRKEMRRFGMTEESVYPELSNVCESIAGRFIEGDN